MKRVIIAVFVVSYMFLALSEMAALARIMHEYKAGIVHDVTEAMKGKCK